MTTLKKAILFGLAMALVIIIVLALLATASFQASVMIVSEQYYMLVDSDQTSHTPSLHLADSEGSSGGGTGGG